MRAPESELTRRHHLKFTGNCTLPEFETLCAEQDFWYHSYYFDNGFVQRGDYDIGHDIAAYGFPQDMTGMSVLDVGTGSGWFATYFEQQGAAVRTVDVRGKCDLDIFGRPGYGDLSVEKPEPDRILSDGRTIYHSRVSRGFWIMKDILGLRAEFTNARVYELRPQLFDDRKFDLVFMGALLMHLRDPIGALIAARSVCRNRLIATALVHLGIDEEPRPRMTLMSPETNVHSWWIPNKACLLQWFRGAGFTKFQADRTVSLTVDKPMTDNSGRRITGALDQQLVVIDAYV